MKAFTLIEILVSVAIFTVVMTIALGALLAISTSDAKVETLKSVTDNLNFAIDSMSRALRTGTNWGCGTTPGANCTTGANEIVFTSSSGVTTYYRLDSLVNDSTNAAADCGQVSPNVGCLERAYSSSGPWTPLTSPDVIINDLSQASPPSYVFYVVGAPIGSSDNVQPKVVITIAGFATVSAAEQSAFYLQTSIEQRLYDQ